MLIALHKYNCSSYTSGDGHACHTKIIFFYNYNNNIRLKRTSHIPTSYKS